MESNHAISTAEIKQQMQVLQGEKQNVRKQINELTQKKMAPTVDTRSAWERAQGGGFLEEVDSKSAVAEELELLEGQERFLDEAIQGGRKELDRVRGQESLKACEAARPAVVAEGKRVLVALRDIEKANRNFRKILADLHDKGNTTGSLGFVNFDLGGVWNDPRGGRLVFHCKDVAEHYPELKDLAMSPLEAE